MSTTDISVVDILCQECFSGRVQNILSAKQLGSYLHARYVRKPVISNSVGSVKPFLSTPLRCR
jgi:hypothetical protein